MYCMMPFFLAVHPHACGEYEEGGVHTNVASGPSPRVWGILVVWIRHRAGLRSIPTRVGNTSPLSYSLRRPRSIPTPVGNTVGPAQSLSLTAVHPHACGEYGGWSMPDKTKNGPSPRVWGILGIGGRTCFTLRSIPTRVGNISLYLYTCTTITVHPHACGEYLVKQPGCAVQLGPSPRVWGIRHQQVVL